MADYLTTTAKMAASAGVIAFVLGCLFAESLSHGSSSQGSYPGVDQALKDIWSAN